MSPTISANSTWRRQAVPDHLPDQPARLESGYGLPGAEGDEPRPGQPGRAGDDAHLAAEGRRPDHLRGASRPGRPTTPPRTAISPPMRNGRMSARPPTSSSRPRSSTTASFAPFDGWKDITVHCTSPGGGGFAPLPQDNPDLPQPQADWQGEVTRRRQRRRQEILPAQGPGVFAVEPPGARRFRLPHQLLERRLLHRHGDRLRPGQRRLRGARARTTSRINRTRSIQCTLQEIEAGAGDRRHRQARTSPATIRNFDPDADDLRSSTPTQTPASRTLPPVVVDPGRKCLPSQRLVRGKCVDRPLVAACRSTEKRVNGKCSRASASTACPATIRSA